MVHIEKRDEQQNSGLTTPMHADRRKLFGYDIEEICDE
jgi:hypothetical protein